MSSEMEATGAEPRRTPLFELHRALGARMTPFAGYAMPLHYEAGILAEHKATRAKAGLFDVSHMGQIRLRAKTGGLGAAAAALETLAPMDFQGLKPGRQRYGLLTSHTGGILDDFMVAAVDDHLALVVNAARKASDLAHLQANLSESCEIEPLEDRALLALQGPEAEAALAAVCPEAAATLSAMLFMDVQRVTALGAECLVSRSGYTGEDGFEISVPADKATELAQSLLDDDRVSPIGLGARDSLRLEAGLCLYGVDLDEGTSPVEGALEWAIQKIRRPGGARDGGYPGADRIGRQLTEGAARRRVGLLPEGRAPMRGSAPLFVEQSGGETIGVVSSGVFGPSLAAPCAMGYVETEFSRPGTRLFAEVRGKRLAAEVVETPFVPARYKRR